MDAFIAPPVRIPAYLRLGLWVVRRRTGVDLLPPRLLSWYPRAAISSGILEALVAHRDRAITERILKMVRMAVSFTASCAFCIGMNSEGWEEMLSPEELAAIQGHRSLESVGSLTDRERLAIEYARLASSTPLVFTTEFGQRLTSTFTAREIVVLASTSAQVNYWARLIQALGCPAQG
ncbi:MAG: carboxymuconolactone decarboxylase family protein [Actinobacteria bacterium]|nr:carboxymuconolactone decarboxylase family protein [Actinomycetota bacterium]